MYIRMREVAGSQYTNVGRLAMDTTTNGLDLREGPNGTAFVTIPAGTRFRVIDTSNSSWYLVLTPFGMGYVSASFVKFL